MSETAAPAASAPASAPSAPSTPSSNSSSTQNSSSTSVPSGASSRSTTADLASKLYGQPQSDVAPDLEAQLETPESSSQQESPWHETYKQVHGLEAAEILQALQNGEIPEALYDKLRFTLKDGEIENEVDLHTLRNGAMMQSAFTRKTQELAEERRAFQAEYNEFADYLRGWKTDPQQMLYGMERLQLPILEVAKLLAERLTKADAMNAAFPGSGDEWMAAEQMKAEMADLKRAQTRAAEQAEAAKNADRQGKIRSQLQNASKEVFSKIGLELEESSWSLYTQHVQAIYDAKPAGQQKLTKSDLERAARATKSQIDKYAQDYLQRKPKKAPGLGTVPLDPGAPKTVPSRAPQKPGKKTTEQIFAEMQERQRAR